MLFKVKKSILFQTFFHFCFQKYFPPKKNRNYFSKKKSKIFFSTKIIFCFAVQKNVFKTFSQNLKHVFKTKLIFSFFIFSKKYFIKKKQNAFLKSKNQFCFKHFFIFIFKNIFHPKKVFFENIFQKKNQKN